MNIPILVVKVTVAINPISISSSRCWIGFLVKVKIDSCDSHLQRFICNGFQFLVSAAWIAEIYMYRKISKIFWFLFEFVTVTLFFSDLCVRDFLKLIFSFGSGGSGITIGTIRIPINEYKLNNLSFASKPPAAEKFMRWWDECR